ncbi:septin 7 [Nematocida sp. LUAm3]|nr:septin 7 [Nematocida sp. LUAm3]KAI5176928.1 septin 7 [Nematocida sp. LUAm1]
MEETNALVSALPGQIVRNIEKTGIYYNLIVVGEGYSGKTSFIKSLFNLYMDESQLDDEFFHEVCDMACTASPLASLLETPGEMNYDSSKITITASRGILTEGPVKIFLTIYEISNVGDSMYNRIDWCPIRNLIYNRYEEYHIEEENVTNTMDKRIHCCLYFLNPRTVPREIDLKIMQELGDKVNLIPVISKADILDPEEYKAIKDALFSELMSNKVKLFDSILIDECKKVVEINFLPLRYSTPNRIYTYSTETQPTSAGDLIVLKNILIQSHMIDLIETTEKFYEEYRQRKLIIDLVEMKQEGSGLDDNFKRTILLHEKRIEELKKKIKAKKQNYQLLLEQCKEMQPQPMQEAN